MSLLNLNVSPQSYCRYPEPETELECPRSIQKEMELQANATIPQLFFGHWIQLVSPLTWNRMQQLQAALALSKQAAEAGKAKDLETDAREQRINALLANKQDAESQIRDLTAQVCVQLLSAETATIKLGL